MDSRDRILSRVKANQPASKSLPNIERAPQTYDLKERFISTLTSIGGVVMEIHNNSDILAFVENNFRGKNIVTTIDSLFTTINTVSSSNPRQLDGVDLAILPGEFGVAENGSIWITDTAMGDRALPYITEHLALVIERSQIVPTLHDAYDRIDRSSYQLGTFIAGPSKTADIEQSLVLGAHGAKSLIVFLIG